MVAGKSLEDIVPRKARNLAVHVPSAFLLSRQTYISYPASNFGFDTTSLNRKRHGQANCVDRKLPVAYIQPLKPSFPKATAKFLD